MTSARSKSERCKMSRETTVRSNQRISVPRCIQHLAPSTNLGRASYTCGIMLIVNNRIRVPLSEFEFTYARSSGPGGQNVNKVNSKVLLRWPMVASTCLPAEVRERFLARFASRLTTEGELLLTSQRYRDQGRNIQDCLDKLREMIQSVVARPKVRRPTKPTKGSQVRRTTAKRENAQKKQGRRPPKTDDS